MSAGPIQRGSFLVVDPLDFKSLMQVVPMIWFHRRAPQSPLGSTAANKGESLALRMELGGTEFPNGRRDKIQRTGNAWRGLSLWTNHEMVCGGHGAYAPLPTPRHQRGCLRDRGHVQRRRIVREQPVVRAGIERLADMQPRIVGFAL